MIQPHTVSVTHPSCLAHAIAHYLPYIRETQPCPYATRIDDHSSGTISHKSETLGLTNRRSTRDVRKIAPVNNFGDERSVHMPHALLAASLCCIVTEHLIRAKEALENRALIRNVDHRSSARVLQLNFSCFGHGTSRYRMYE